MIHRVTININNPTYRKEEIIDDGKPWADDRLLARYMAEMVRDYIKTHQEQLEGRIVPHHRKRGDDPCQPAAPAAANS